MSGLEWLVKSDPHGWAGRDAATARRVRLLREALGMRRR
jgi:hypothetical protein